MRIEDVMRRDVMTVPTSTPASEAWALMRDEGVRHAIVVTRGKLVGVVSDRDLGGTRGGSVRRARTVGDLMTRNVVTASPATTVALAAHVLREQHIGCLPVLEHGHLVGIVTTSDLLALLEAAVAPAAPTLDVPRRRPTPETPPRLVSPNVDKHP